ncbi:unnamed protein product, partial [Nesidiocoris tenuis]
MPGKRERRGAVCNCLGAPSSMSDEHKDSQETSTNGSRQTQETTNNAKQPLLPQNTRQFLSPTNSQLGPLQGAHYSDHLRQNAISARVARGVQGGAESSTFLESWKKTAGKRIAYAKVTSFEDYLDTVIIIGLPIIGHKLKYRLPRYGRVEMVRENGRCFLSKLVQQSVLVSK